MLSINTPKPTRGLDALSARSSGRMAGAAQEVWHGPGSGLGKVDKRRKEEVRVVWFFLLS